MTTTSDATVRLFTDVTAVTPTTDLGTGDSGIFTALIDDAWTIGGKPNGGYLESIMARAAASVSAHPHVLIASAHYFRSPDPGPAELDVEFIGSGRSTSQVRVRMLQEGRPKVEAMFTFGVVAGAEAVAGEGAPPRWQHAGAPGPGLPYDECIVHSSAGGSFDIPIRNQLEVRMEPEALGFTRGEPRGIGELRAWVDLPGQTAFDTIGLLLAADIMPPATFDLATSGWVPTLELTTYIRALPAPGPVNLHFIANLIQGERVDETCTIWDSEGTLVAQAHQLAGIRLG